MSQTIEDLKEMGFHANNFVICSHPASVVDVKLKQQAIIETCKCCNQNIPNPNHISVLMPVRNVTPEIIERVNNSTLVAIYLHPTSYEKPIVRFDIIDEFLFQEV